MQMKTLNSIINGEVGNYIAPFLWLHNEDDSLIENELHRIHDCGIGAVCIESRTHEEFCRNDWWSDVALILDTCKSLGMKVWILDDKHFPSGYANGIFEREENKSLRALCIHSRRVDISGPVTSGSILADEWKELDDDRFIGAVALRRTEDGQAFDGGYIDISENYAHGRYYFVLPEGKWAIVMIIASQSDIAPGSRCYGNHLSSDATDAYISEVYESHYKRFADDFGDTLLGFFTDEPQFHNWYNQASHIIKTGKAFVGSPWHDSLMSCLASLYPDDTMAKLCRLWYDFSDNSHMSVRESYMDIITRQYSEAFSKRIGQWCENHGVMHIGHIIEDNGAHRATGFGAGHYFRALEGHHMAGVDIVLNQLLPGLCEISTTAPASYMEADNKQFHYVHAKLASSSAHTEAEKKGRAMCEVFGAFGWAEDTEFMKFLLDHFIVRGINYFVPHAFSPKENDTDCPPNFYNTGRNPQYKYFGMLMRYINRICTLMDGAVHIPTCAVIYDAEASWASSDFTDNRDICKMLYDNCLDYDIIPFDRLCDITDDGYINGEYYPVILLPYSEYYNSEALKKIERLKDRIICVGEKSVGDMRSVALSSLPDIMEGYRDISVAENAKYLRYAYYKRGNERIYLLSNEDTVPMSLNLKLRGFDGGRYVLWDAFENKAVCRDTADGNIPLRIYPNNLIVLFADSDFECGNEALVSEVYSCPSELDVQWRVELCREKDMPHYEYYKTFSRLKSITSHDEMPDFSGNMRYTASIQLDPKRHRMLDLGTVGQTAEVYLNGKCIGVRIFAPYSFDMSGAIKDGDNELEIIISNTCVYEQRDIYSRYMLIKPSGLIGPVSIG